MTAIQTVLEQALRHRRQADELLVIGDETSVVQVRWAGNELTTNGTVRGRRLTVVALRTGDDGVRAGVVSHAGPVDGRAVSELVTAAERAAGDSGVTADGRPLPAPATVPSWAEPPAATGVEVFGALLPGLRTAFARAAAGQRQLHGYAEHQVVTTYLASSSGTRLRHVQPTGLLDLTARSPKHGTSAWAGVSTADFAGVDVRSTEAELAARLDRGDRQVALPPGRYEVLLTPSCVADLMLHLYLAAGARGALDGRTAFSRPDGALPIGERITGTPLTLRSDPEEPGLRCSPYAVNRAADDLCSVFDNGLPLHGTRWIDDGVLAALVQTRHTAELTGQPPTARVDNLVLEGRPDAPSLSEMVRTTRRGLLVTSLWYLRDVDPRTLLLTGLTRDGVHLVRDGEVVGAVNNFRFNESPLSLLARATEVGRSVPALPREWGDYFTRMSMPPLRIPDFAMSAVSSAT